MKRPRKNKSQKSQPLTVRLDLPNLQFVKGLASNGYTLSAAINKALDLWRSKEIESEASLEHWRSLLYKK